MAILHPFKAWHPRPENVEDIACVPYDVINTQEARELAKSNPNSFLHVIRPEIDLPPSTDPYTDEVYEKGAENLLNLLNSDAFTQDEPQVYVYRLTNEERTQTGVFACVSVEDYDNEIILKHELTRPKKENDRTRHILTQQAHAEPVMMTFKDDARTKKLLENTVNKTPFMDFKASDGVRHQVWRANERSQFIEAFAKIPHLYIADGHHRCKSASRVAEEMKKKNPTHTGDEEYNFFPAVLFPMSDMEILPYNRLIHNIPDNFLATLKQKFDLVAGAPPKPSKKGTVSIYIADEWYSLELPISNDPNSVEKLDVYRLHKYLLSPLLDIKDPRRNENISFIGGIKGTKELKRLVDNGEGAMAISMYPTSIEELVKVSDEKRLMPPKSTWFEPKLRSGLLIHTF